MPVIPASAKRAAPDAAAVATGQRGFDPLRLARRIAATLNAPGSGVGDPGFFWLTAVTIDGAIVVANSYGLAYIPDGVWLPEEVRMASADDAIPATERARWATHPLNAVQAWAAHHRTTLRAVIATAEQFANSDPGVTEVVLQPGDIPSSANMIGRSRLQVADPEAADRLDATADPRLVELLPPAPADVEAPADRRRELWLGVVEPVTSSAKDREAAHLRAFHTYTAAAREAALNEAHTAVDSFDQRAAVADWLYWKHVAQTLDDALTVAS